MVHGLMLKVSGKQTAGTKISEYNIKRDVVIDISFFAFIGISHVMYGFVFILFLIGQTLINFEFIIKDFVFLTV